MVKTSLTLPESIHKRLAHAAIDEDRDMGEILTDALEAYFSNTPKRKSSKERASAESR